VNLKKLFRPKSLAIVGGYWADFVIQGNRKLGFKGPIWHINPTRESNKINKYYKNINELPGIPDCVYIAVSRDLTVNVIKDFKSLGAGGAVCLASRFSETNSKEGVSQTKQLIKNSGKMPFLGPNCYGFINYLDKVSVWSDQIAGNPCKKGIALICQSGTIGNTVSFNHRSLPLGYIISVGNQTCVTIEDVIGYVLNDKRVTAIGIYAESFNNIKLFYKVLEKAKKNKVPVAIVKVGRSKIASETIMSHTGSLSGKEDIYDSIFKQLGATRCNTLAELCETLKIFHIVGALKGNKIAIMGPSGGDMAMVGDVSEGLAINYSPIPKLLVKNLKKVNHKGIIISNPFDLQTYNWNDPKSLRKTFDLMFKANFDLIGLMLDFPNMNECDIDEWEAIVDEYILSAKEKNKKAAIIASLPETLPEHIREKCLKSSIVPLQGLKESLYAIHCSILVGQAWSKFNILKVIQSENTKKTLKKTYSEYESKKILKNYGIRVPQSILSNVDRALIDSKKIGFPIAIKINSKKILHKSEVKGVFTNIDSETKLKKSLKHLSKLGKQFLIEKMIHDQVAAMLLGIKIDNQFGPVIVIGTGGIYTELIKDSVTLLLPLKKSLVLKAINNLKISKLLYGYRGKPKGDIKSLIQTILKLGKFAEKNASRLIEVEINPLIVRSKVKGVIAADALIHYLEEIK
jgi:acetyl-CoA synthetase